jgi:hypothetical protein
MRVGSAGILPASVLAASLQLTVNKKAVRPLDQKHRSSTFVFHNCTHVLLCTSPRAPV